MEFCNSYALEGWCGSCIRHGLEIAHRSVVGLSR
jgi:hypothetical protein